MFTKQQIMDKIKKQEKFDPTTASSETLELRRKCRKFKKQLMGTGIKVGNKTFYFGGAGPDNLLLHFFVSGADTTQASGGKLWVIWGKENPLIRKTLLSEIEKIQINGKNEVLNDVSLKEEYQRTKTKVQPSSAEQLGFIPASEYYKAGY